MAKFYAISDVREAAQGRWRDVLGRFGVHAKYLEGRHGPCPGCKGKDRFRFDDIGGNGTFVCSQGSGDLLVGDGLKLLGHVKGWDWKRCVQEVGDELNVRHREGAPAKGEGVKVAPKPVPSRNARPEVDNYMLWEATRGVPSVDADWLRRRSPVAVTSLGAGGFLDQIFEEGERILIFTETNAKGAPWTQGDFLWQCGRGGFRLAQERGVRAVKSDLPEGGRDGVWYLVQPVTGQWEAAARDGGAMWTRRSQPNVTGWRHFVLESDELALDVWLRVLVALAFPIAAIYSSGGRSIHALVRMPVASKAEWDAARDMLRQIVCPLGADPGALSAVRLSRLPGCLRGQKRQELLFLNPRPEARPIFLMPEVRA